MRDEPPTVRGDEPYIENEISHAVLAREIKPRGADASWATTPLWDRALNRIEENGAQLGLISYEHFATQPLLYRWEMVRERLARFHVTGLVYLREPVAWAVSLYGQALRRRSQPRFSFGEFVENSGISVRFSNLLDHVRARAPVDDLRVLNFHEAAEKGLVPHFLASAGLNGEIVEAGAAHPIRNQSVSVAALLFIRRCNRAGLSHAAGEEMRRALGRAEARGEMPRLPPGLAIVAPDQLARLRAEAVDDAQRLAGDWGVTFPEGEAPAEQYRRFDDDDFYRIRVAIQPRLSTDVRVRLTAI